MSASNDFFVKFGSNATTWSRDLDRQLKPARDQVLALEAMLDRLERRGQGVGSGLTRALGQDLSRRANESGGTTPAGSDRVSKNIVYDLDKVSDALADVVTSLRVTMQQLQNLPQTVKTAMNSVRGYGNHPGDHPNQQRNVFTGTYATAGAPGAVPASIASLVSTLKKQNAVPTVAAAPVSISGVGSAAVMEAGLKRVTDAIESQTRTLSAALKGIKVEAVPGTGTVAPAATPASTSADTPARKRKESTAQAVAQTEEQMVATVLDTAQKNLAEAKSIYATMEAAGKRRLAALEAEHSTESDIYRAQKAEIEGYLKDQRAIVAQAERNASGITRAEQKEERVAAAKAAKKEIDAAPVISEQEIARRQKDLDLIRSTVDPNFLNQVGRKREEYGIPELREMGRALKEQGFDPGFRANDRMDAMALKLQDAGEKFSRAFGDSVPDNLRTTGFKTYRETEIGPALQKVLAAANDEVIQAYARQRDEDRQILRSSYMGGDTGDLSRGRRTFGASVLPEGQALPGQIFSKTFDAIAGKFSEQEIREAEERLKRSPNYERDTALAQLRADPNFNPYGAELSQAIKPGNTDEERQRAADARLFIRNLRDSVTEIDAYGRALVNAKDSISLFDAQIKEFRGDLARDAMRDKDDPERMSRSAVARREKAIEDMEREREDAVRLASDIGRAAKGEGIFDLINSPEYLRGLPQREAGQRDYQRAVTEYREGTRTSDYNDLRNGLGDALRQYMGSNFRFNQSKGRIGHADSLPREDANELNNAFRHYIAVLRQATDAARRGTPGENNLPSRFENATVGLLNQLEKNFNGLAPRFEELASLGLDKMGYPQGAVGYDITRIQDPANQVGEDRREAARQAAEAAKKNIKKSDMGPQAAAEVAAEEATRTAKNLAKAQDEQAQTAKDLAKTNRERNRNLKKMTADERAAVEQATQDLRTLTDERRRLENIFLLEDQGARAKSMKDDDSRFVLRERSVDATVDEFGYPAQYGYGKDLGAKKKELDDAIMAARMVANRAFDAGDDDDFRKKSEELERLIAGRQARTQAISDARSEGDLKENAGYTAAREAQSMAEGRIKQLTAELTKLSPVDKAEDLKDQLVSSKKVVASLEAQLAAANEKAEKAAKKAAKAVEEGAAPLTTGPTDRDALIAERKALKAEGPWKRADIKELEDDAEVDAARARRSRIMEINRAVKAVDDSTAATAKAAASTAKKVREVVKAADGEVEKLRAERTQLRAQGPYTRGDVKGLRTAADEAEDAVSGRRLGASKAAITRAENRGERAATITAMREALAARQDEAKAAREAADAAEARARRIREINKRLNELEGKTPTGGGSGTGGGGRVPPTPAAPGGPGDDGVLAKILAAINAMHATLKKGGIRVSGAVEGTLEPTVAKPTGTVTAKSRSRLTDEERKAREEGLAESRRLENEKRSLRNEQSQAQIDATAASRRSKATAAIREQEQAAQTLAAAMGRLSAATHKEIQELERLSRLDTTGMDKAARDLHQRAIAQQQIRTYGAVDQDLLQQRISGTDRRTAAGAVLNQFGPQASGNELASISRAARAQNPSMMMDRQLAGGVPDPDQSEWMQAWGNMFGNKGFWGRIVGSTGAFIVRNFAAGMVFGLTNQLQMVLDQALQTEMTFVRVSQALEATNKPIGNLRSDLQNISTDYGVALNDVYNSAAALQGLFGSTDEIAAATRVSTQLQVISNGALNAAEAVGVLASVYTAFQSQPELQGAEGLQKIADTFTLLQNELGVNIETSAEGVGRLAGAAESMGLSFQETAVYAGQVAKLTNQTGAAAGEQLQRIMASTLTGRGQNALRDAFTGVIDEKTGRDIGAAMENALAAGDQGAVLQNMMMGWDELTKTQQDNLAITIAGQRQMASFQGLMHDTESTLNLITKAYRANGEAEDRMAALMNTLNKQIDVLRQNFTNFALALIESGVLNFFGSFLMGVNAVLKTVNDLLGAFNSMAEATPFVKFLRDTVTWAAGAALTFKLLGTSLNGLRGALRMNVGENGVGGVLSGVRGAPTRDQPNTVPIGPGARGSWEHRDSLNQPVSRAGFSQFGPRGPQLGIARTAAFGIDRVIRVPLERTGRILEKGGLKWEQANNQYVRKLGVGATFLSRQFSDAGRVVEMGVRTSVPRDSGPTRTSALQRFADSRQARADALSGRYTDQRNLALQTRLGGDPARQAMLAQWRAGGMSLYDETKRSTVDPSLQRQARTQQMLASVASGTSTALSRTSTALKSVASSGLAADAALVGLGLVIASVVSYRNQIKDIRGTVEDSAAAYAKPKKPDEKSSTEWMGPAMLEQQEAADKFEKDGAGFTAGLGAIWDSSVSDFGRMMGGLFTDGDKVSEIIARDTMGIDYDRGANTDFTAEEQVFADRLKESGSPLADQMDIQGRKFVFEGMTEAADMYSNYMDELGMAASGQMGYIPDALNDTEEKFRTDLQTAAAKIKGDKDMSEGQKRAALAYIEMLDELITAEIADKTAVSSGLATGLNTNQLGALQAAIGSLNAEREMDGGIDMSAIVDEQIDAAGLKPGSSYEKQLTKLRRGGQTTAERLQTEYKLLQDAAKAAQANWLAELSKDPGSEEFQAADQMLNALMGEVDRVGKDAVNQILTEAEGLAAAAEAAGLYAKAARIRLRAMRDVNKFNRNKAGDPGPAAGVTDASADAPRGFTRGADPQENNRGKKRRATKDPALVAGFQAVVQNAIYLATKDITLQIARTSDAAVRAGLVALKAQIEGSILTAVNSGAGISGIDVDALPPKGQTAINAIPQDVVDLIDKGARDYGSAAVNEQQVFDSQVAATEAQTSYSEAQAAAAEQAASGSDDAASKAAEARQNAAALKQARLGVAAAGAEARGDAVAAAKIQVAIAKAQLQAAKIELGFAKTDSEIAQARIAVLNAQAAVVSASAGVQSAQQDLIQSQYEVSIALAEAAGKTVLAAERQLGAARQALAAARKKSGGKATAEVNAARVSLIQAQAAARDAALQDQLDTIDFNLEMGRTTQSAAISALQEILRTSDLTKAQRRQLLLQIKGMKDEMADSQWNFGDIKLPTPYQMKRYIRERREQFAGELEGAAQNGGRGKPKRRDELMGLGAPSGNEVKYGNGAVNNTTTIYINGADIQKVRKVVQDVVGGGRTINTRTSGARRGNR
jgi:transcription elongation GreA/GreB family factor